MLVPTHRSVWTSISLLIALWLNIYIYNPLYQPSFLPERLLQQRLGCKDGGGNGATGSGCCSTHTQKMQETASPRWGSVGQACSAGSLRLRVLSPPALVASGMGRLAVAGLELILPWGLQVGGGGRGNPTTRLSLLGEQSFCGRCRPVPPPPQGAMAPIQRGLQGQAVEGGRIVPSCR